MKTKRTWAFWYEVDRNGQRIVIDTYDCSEPERTKIRKIQKRLWDNPDVTSIGYTSELTDRWLIWPSSNLNPRTI